ncbi:MAG: FtsX-like permease family protein [Betaproteobacteria bacterium]|nr:FtsX-like permease family protein [Betaproteobacteria bacterium]
MKSRLALPVLVAKREMRRDKLSFALSTITMTLAVAMLGSVLGLTDALRFSISQDARALRGGDADVELESRSFTEEELIWFGENSERLTESSYMRAAAFTRSSSAQIALRAVDDKYPLFGKMEMSDGSDYRHDMIASPPTAAKIPVLIGEELIETLGGIGSEFSIGAATVQIVGHIKRVPDPNSAMMLSAPMVYIDRGALPATGLHLPGALKDENVRVDLGERDFEEWKQSLASAFPDAPWRVRGLDNTVPGLRRVLGRAEALMLLASLGTLLVAGICVGNTISSFLRSRLTSIAMLKALGMPGRQLRTSYTLVAMIFALASCAIGMPLAYIGQEIIVEAMSARLPIEVHTSVTWRQYALVPAVALLTAWVFIAEPMQRFSAVSAASLFSASAGLDFIDEKSSARKKTWPIVAGPALVIFALLFYAAGDRKFLLWFVAGGAATCIIFRLLAETMISAAGKIKPPGSALRIALRMLARSGGSVSSAATALGIGLTSLLTLTLTQANFENELDATLRAEVPAFYLVGMQSGDANRIRSAAGDLLADDTLHELPVQRARITHLGGVPREQIKPPDDKEWVLRGDRFITWAADPANQWRGASRVSTGEHWPSGATGLVSFDEEAALAFGLKIGDSVGLNILGQTFDVTIANMRRIDWSTFDVNFVMVLSDGPWNELPHGYLGSVRRVNGDEDEFQRLAVATAPSVTPIRTRQVIETANNLLRKVGALISAVMLTAIVSGVLVLAAAISEGRHRRARDSVILRMLGSSRRLLASVFRTEFIVIAALAAIPALGAAALCSYAISTRILQLPWSMDPIAAGAIVGATLLIVQLLGAASTFRLVRNPPLALLRNE